MSSPNENSASSLLRVNPFASPPPLLTPSVVAWPFVTRRGRPPKPRTTGEGRHRRVAYYTDTKKRYSEAIDVTTYGRQRDKLREELTLAKIDHHAEAVDELDVEGIRARQNTFCERQERVVSRTFTRWNHICVWLRQIERLLSAA